MKLGLSGNLTRGTIGSPLTPLMMLAALAVGLLALFAIPREEEPQISVPMIDIQVRADGLKAQDAVELVSKPLETIVKGIDGVEHVYSQTIDGAVVVTARFVVGTDPDSAIMRVHEKVRANYDKIPVGIPEPLIVGRGINDVPIFVVTLSPKPGAAERWPDSELYKVADELRSELAKVDNVGLSFIVGGQPEQIQVQPDPARLSLYGVTLQQLVAKGREANTAFAAGRLRQTGAAMDAEVGQTLNGVPDIGQLLLTTRDGRAVYIQDVADVVVGPRPQDSRVWTLTRADGQSWTKASAVSLAFAKRAGANAVNISSALEARLHEMEGRLIPTDLAVEITRNYGETANEKANELLFHLGLATISIVLLIAFAIGYREAVVTFVVIPTTILLTLFAANLMGYTINRVSLFALIFSIGILVDDAIVVIENIARHWAMRDGRSRSQAAVEAVAEVGNPTIVATLTVIAALLPMLFVSGLMGPYMAPIPANASAAMIFSFFVAMVIAPWLMVKLAPRESASAGVAYGHHGVDRLGSLYQRVAAPVLRSPRRAWIFLLAVGAATLLSLVLFATGSVTVKLLPFDNKSELQVVVDLPEGASVEDTQRILSEVAARAGQMSEVVSMQAYAGTASPFNFNGLVRHYYMRSQPEQGDVQLNLLPKSDRSRESHDIALDLRQRLVGLDLPDGSSVKVVEVPPGPPVMATLLAEIYGPDPDTRRAVAAELRKIFASVPYIVDIDDSFGQQRPRLRIAIDQEQVEFFGVRQSDVYDTVRTILDGVPVGYSHRGEGRDPIEIVVRLPKSGLSWNALLASTPVPADQIPGNKGVVELGDVVKVSTEEGSYPIYRRNGRFAEMVTAELAGAYEAPIYGMMDVANRVHAHDWGALPKPEILIYGQPGDESRPSLLWDGEWEITYVTFRDMGAAFMVAILAIYVLVVAQFGSFRLPLVILTPIPLTLIGIMIGHWLLGAAFTATSMIGFIALAGIIVRNSILLVDFIRHGKREDASLYDTLLEAGAIRFKPILLTAIAAMIGAVTILLDPIFEGLAISLLFGLASSTLLTVLVIPAIYVALRSPAPKAADSSAI